MEEFEIGETDNIDKKEIELSDGDNKYICSIQKNKNYLEIFLNNNNVIKYKGNIYVSNIEYILGICNFNINDIFHEIYNLNKNKFNIKKDNNKYQLKIEFIILNQKRYLNIDLNEYIENENDTKFINELKEIIKDKDNKIKLLKEELNKYKKINDDNYNIELKDKNKKQKDEDDDLKLQKQRKDEEEEKPIKEKEKSFIDLKNQNEKEITQKNNKQVLLKKENKKKEGDNKYKELKRPKINYPQIKIYSFECKNPSILKRYLYVGTQSLEIRLTLENTGLLHWPQKETKLVFDENYQIKGRNVELNPLYKNEKQKCILVIGGLANLPAGEYETGVYLNIRGINIGHIIKIEIIIVEREIDLKQKNIEIIKQFRTEYDLDKNEYSDDDLYEILKDNAFNFEHAFLSIIGEL